MLFFALISTFAALIVALLSIVDVVVPLIVLSTYTPEPPAISPLPCRALSRTLSSTVAAIVSLPPMSHLPLIVVAAVFSDLFSAND